MLMTTHEDPADVVPPPAGGAATALRDAVARLSVSADALAALGAALDARASDVPLAPALRVAVDETLSALGAAGAMDALAPGEAAPLLARLRCFALTNARLLFAETRDAGWAGVEPAVLEAAGDATAGFAEQLATRIAPQLEGLVPRLGAPGAAFLDIGVGVGALAVAMARLWPRLRVVGVDPLAPALAAARRRVAEAGLEGRIELRRGTGETLADEAAYDLAWVPGAFVAGEALPAVVGRAARALRPGGWLLVPVLDPGAGGLVTASARLRTAAFGGTAMEPGAAAALLAREGLAEARALPAPPGALTTLVVGRRR